MVTIPCTGQSEARGRNRWFRLAEAELTLFHHGHADEARLCLDLYSRRRGRSAPVILRADGGRCDGAGPGPPGGGAAARRGAARERRDAGDGGRSYPPRRAARRVSAHPTCARGGQAPTTEAAPPHPAPAGWGRQRPVCPCRGSTR